MDAQWEAVFGASHRLGPSAALDHSGLAMQDYGSGTSALGAQLDGRGYPHDNFLVKIKFFDIEHDNHGYADMNSFLRDAFGNRSYVKPELYLGDAFDLIMFPKIMNTTLSNSGIPEIHSTDDQQFEKVRQNLINGFIALICILGLVGNGRTIYLLAYSIKRNPFTTLILNLSIADSGVITSLIISVILAAVSTLGENNDIVKTFFLLFFELFYFTYSVSQFLLTAISLDRCVAVLFPLWHRCHRPSNLSTFLCSFIWIFSFLLSALHYILHQTKSFGSSPFLYQLIVNGLLCTPLMVVSTVTLWIQVRSKSQRNQRKLLTTILLALLFFLLFSLPMYVLYVVYYFGFRLPDFLTIGIGCATLNSSINPLLYFLVGMKKRGKNQPRASLKVALQRVFKDEQESSEGEQTTEEDIV